MNYPTYEKPKRGNDYTLPQNCIYKIDKCGTYFIFKPGGPLYEKLKKVKFGNDEPVNAAML